MNRSTFRRRLYARPPVSLPRPVRAVAPTVFTDLIVSQPKEDVVRSEPYRRLVAGLPCKSCGIQGYSQAAHVPPDAKGTKQDDREIFALCCTRMGITGCHVEFDQYRMFPKSQARLIGRAWAADTRRQIIAMRLWPKSLPMFEEKTIHHARSIEHVAMKIGAIE